MKKFLSKIAASLAALLLMSVNVEACTIILVTKGASEDGSVFLGHSDDEYGSDPNLAFVPARNHKKGSMRPVYPTAAAIDELPEYNAFDCPQLIAPERSDAYNFPGYQHTKADWLYPRSRAHLRLYRR